MTASRASGLAATLLAVMLAASPAWSQGGAPLPLKPGPEPPAPEAPAPEVQPKVLPEIRIRGLVEVDPEAIGLLEAGQGGFGAGMWAQTPRRVVERLLPHLPAGFGGRAGGALMRRLLLSSTPPPAGDERAANLVALRVERLLAMGDFASAADLLGASPGRSTDPDLMRSAVTMHLFAYDFAAACNLVRNVEQGFGAGFWQRALIFCQAQAGEQTQALFGLDLLREGGEVDETFVTLVEALAGGDGAEVAPGTATALTLALLRAAEGPVPAVYVVDAGPAILRAIANSDNADIGLRLEAAQRAEAAGGLSAEELVAIYDLVELSPQELAEPSKAAKADGGLRGELILHRAARERVVPTARAELLRQMLNQAQARGAHATAARVAAPLLADIPPSSEFAWFAGDAARALLAAGRADLALSWYRLAQFSASTDGNAAMAEAVLWPLLRLALGDGGAVAEVEEVEEGRQPAEPQVVAVRPLAPVSPLAWDVGRLTAWRSTRDVFAPEAASDQIMLLYSLFEALGEPLTESDWQMLVGATASAPVSRPPPAELWFGLERAAAEGRVGETVLRALIMLGDDGLGRTDPIVLAAAIRGLVKVGLAEEARSLAVEAALAAGL